MRNRFFIALLLAVIALSGCHKSSVESAQVKDIQVTDQQQWMADYQNKDTRARTFALSKASDGGRAKEMELAADKATYDKMVALSHQPNFSNMPENERIQQTRNLLTEAENAKTRMRDSGYSLQFQPKW